MHRPSLGVQDRKIDEIARSVAADYGTRAEFLARPELFLKARGVRADGCRMTESSSAPTAEVCTAVAVCAAVMFVDIAIANIVAIANAAANMNVSVNYNYS